MEESVIVTFLIARRDGKATVMMYGCLGRIHFSVTILPLYLWRRPVMERVDRYHTTVHMGPLHLTRYVCAS